MSSRPGQPESKSLRKAEASRANARRPRMASRRGSEESETALRRCIEGLRTGAPEAVALLQRIMADKLYVVRDGLRTKVKVPTSVRLRAATEWLDRCGLVRRSEQTIEIATAKPKLVTLKWFPPPPGYEDLSRPLPPPQDGALAAIPEGVEPADMPVAEPPDAPVVEPELLPEVVAESVPGEMTISRTVETAETAFVPINEPEPLPRVRCPWCDDATPVGERQPNGSVTWRCPECDRQWRSGANGLPVTRPRVEVLR